MKLLGEDSENSLNLCYSVVIDAINDIMDNFDEWKSKHPNIDTTEDEKDIAEIIWTLLKAERQLHNATDEACSLYIGADSEDAERNEVS